MTITEYKTSKLLEKFNLYLNSEKEDLDLELTWKIRSGSKIRKK